jgi:superfamily II DNA or RNA helicase
LLRTQRTRNILLKLLPQDKTQELLARLGLSTTCPDATKQLASIDFCSENQLLEELFSFFGVLKEERAPQPLEQEIETRAVEYGLFSHQRDVVRRVEHVLSEYPRKALLHMPTGAGKTRTAMNLAARHLASQEQTLVCWLAQSSELLEQAAQEFKRAWNHLGNRELPVYRFWGSYTPSLEEARDGILIAGFAKLHALYQRVPNMLMRLGDRTSLTVVDEAHQSIAPTYRSIIQGFHAKRPENRLLGLSATPGRTWNDIAADAELASFFGEKKITLEIPGYSDPVAYLLQAGYLARPSFRLLRTSAKVKETNQGTEREYSDETLDTLALDQQRNRQILDEAECLLSRHRRVILFASSVLHAKLITAVLVSKGYEADVVTGETPSSARERIIRKFKSTDPTPRVICNFGVLTTGFDAPQTSAALVARPTHSLVLYSQMVGRAIRGPKQGGNETAEIVTVVDPELPGFGSIAQAFLNWEDVWSTSSTDEGQQ